MRKRSRGFGKEGGHMTTTNATRTPVCNDRPEPVNKGKTALFISNHTLSADCSQLWSPHSQKKSEKPAVFS